MSEQRITASDFFSTTAAREAGFTDEFWYDAYGLYLDALAQDKSFDLETERTFRVSFGQGHVDVLVRGQPEPREFFSVRFTAFPAEDTTEPRQIRRWYTDDETRPVLGEAALLDSNFRW